MPKNLIYKLIGYDSWGNKRDGWDVNDLWVIRHDIEIAEDASLKDVLKVMKEIGYFKKYVRLNMLDVWNDSEFMIEFTHRATGEPLCRLQLEEY